jgi:hypothetical protein
MMKRTEFTPQKRHQMTTDNEEASIAHKVEMHRQGYIATLTMESIIR